MAADETIQSEAGRGYGLLIKGFVKVVAMLVMVFACAGRVDYWQGWLFSAYMLVLFGAIVFVFLTKPDFADLANERLKPGPGTKWWDKIFWALYIPLVTANILIAPLDAGRFGWTGPLPWGVYVASWVVFLVANALSVWAMCTNKFFSSVVRIQTDRGHTVIQDGPYRFVRHPGYVAGILLGPSMALILGSAWAVVPGAACAIPFLMRTYLEDTALQRELPGYAEYTRKVRYRLLPGIW